MGILGTVTKKTISGATNTSLIDLWLWLWQHNLRTTALILSVNAP